MKDEDSGLDDESTEATSEDDEPISAEYPEEQEPREEGQAREPGDSVPAYDEETVVVVDDEDSPESELGESQLQSIEALDTDNVETLKDEIIKLKNTIVEKDQRIAELEKEVKELLDKIKEYEIEIQKDETKDTEASLTASKISNRQPLLII